MNVGEPHRHAAEPAAGKIPEILVMIAGDIDHPGALARLAQQFLDDVIVQLVPLPVFLQRPVVDDVADQVQRVRLGDTQEIQQQFRLRPPCAQVKIGNPDGAVAG